MLKRLEAISQEEKQKYMDNCEDIEKEAAKSFFSNLHVNLSRLTKANSDGEYEIPSIQNSPVMQRKRAEFQIGPDEVLVEVKKLEKQLKLMLTRIDILEKILKRHGRWFLFLRWGSFLFALLYFLKRRA
jgi:hypothetical protein